MYPYVLFTDVDGTLTPSRATSYIDLGAAKFLRELSLRGFLVVLVSGNSVPVLRGLSLYLGLGGVVVAENGAVVFDRDVRVVCSGCEVVREAVAEVLRYGGGFLRDSWQNRFRLCDRAIKWVGSEDRALSTVLRALKELGFRGVKAVSSGYAVHLLPEGCSKDVGMRAIIDSLGLNNSLKYCIGDSETDLPMRSVCDVLVAVGNADRGLKEVADVVTDAPSSRGFMEFASNLLKQLRSGASNP